MAQLQARLVHLAAARKPIVEALKTVFYPVITLPPEITAEIFLHYVDSAHIGGPGNTDIVTAPGRKGGCGPLLLASICRKWREVALALPPIWSSMQLYAWPQTISATENLLQLWLPRAGSHLLEISIGFPLSTDLLMPLISPYSLQWQAFTCGMYTPITFPGDLIRRRIPLLRKLEVALQVDWNDLNGTPTPVTAFTDAPELREVHLIDFTLEWISLPWAQLTSLKLSGQTPSQYLEILQHTLLLEILCVNLPLPDDGPRRFVRLGHLHTFKLENYDAYISVVDYLTLPALTHLDLPPVEYMLSPLTASLARSACSLRSISIANTPAQCTLAFLRAVPTVGVVRLPNVRWVTWEFSKLFDHIANETDFLPNLRSLSLSPCNTASEIPYALLTAMLAARWRTPGAGAARFESFELLVAAGRSVDPPVDVAQVERGVDELQALVADGLKINIRSLQKMSSTVDALALLPVGAVFD
ncbi:hypothetical protein DFH09DRAFT_1436754 [Mycena vulgaris]|nr:hypothetical protein DFH09DRAFT_1436754 [Mycena vulgaris]